MKVLTGIYPRAKVWRACVWPLVFALCGLVAGAQTQNADLPQAPVPNGLKLPGGVTVEQATPGALPLSLDDAIARGEKYNLQMLLVIQNERMVHGQVLTVENSLLPSLTAKGNLEAQQIDLAALGFKPGSLAAFGISPGTFPTIVKVNTAEAQISMNQQLFNVPAYYLYRSAQKAGDAAHFSTLNLQDAVTLAVGTQYLLALADESQIENAAPQTLLPVAAGFRLKLRKSSQLLKPIERLKGVLVLSGDRAYLIDVPLSEPGATRGGYGIGIHTPQF